MTTNTDNLGHLARLKRFRHDIERNPHDYIIWVGDDSAAAQHKQTFARIDMTPEQGLELASLRSMNESRYTNGSFYYKDDQ